MFWGSDTQDLRGLAVRLEAGGASLAAIGEQIRSMTVQVDWTGPDADRMRARAEAEGSAVLARSAEELARFSRALEGEAEAQDEASAPDGMAEHAPRGAVDGDENKFWFWQDGFAPFWGETADLQDDIPLDSGQFTVDSINQEGTGNCVSLSTLAAVAHADPEFLADHVRRVDREHYEVDLYIDGEWKTVTVSDEVARDGVRGPDGDQNWATLYEQALIQEGVLDEDGEYSSNQQGASVFTAVTGGEFEYGRDGGSADQAMPSYEDVLEAATDGRPVVLCTENSEVSAGGVEIVEQHAYTVESVNADGSITLVNPWGSDSNYGAEDGAHRITVGEDEFDRLFDGVVVGDSASSWEG